MARFLQNETGIDKLIERRTDARFPPQPHDRARLRFQLGGLAVDQVTVQRRDRLVRKRIDER